MASGWEASSLPPSLSEGKRACPERSRRDGALRFLLFAEKVDLPPVVKLHSSRDLTVRGNAGQCQAVGSLPLHLGQAKARSLSPFAHSRQPYGPWWSTRRGICRWLAGFFPRRFPLRTVAKSRLTDSMRMCANRSRFKCSKIASSTPLSGSFAIFRSFQ